MAKTGIKTVTVTGVSRFFLDGEKARVRREIEKEFAAEGKEIVGYTEALPATFLGLLTQDISFTWRQSDEKKLSSVQRTEDRVTVTAENYRSILDRIDLFLEDKEWERASAYCEAALDYAARDADVYVKYLLADLKAGNKKELANCSESFENNENYKKAIRFGSEKLASELNGYISQIKERNRNKELASLYIKAVTALNNAKTEEEYKSAAALFDPVLGFQDADQRKQECLDYADNSRKDKIYNEAILKMSSNSISDIELAIRQFESIKGWRYSDENIEASYELLDEINGRITAEHKEKERTAQRRKRIIGIITPIIVACIAFVFLMTMVIIPKHKYNVAVAKYGQEFVYAFYALNVGDLYKFGSYEQDNDTTNGTEDIEWLVLAKEDSRILVISRYALDCKQYNVSFTGVTWEKCTLRRWLNGTFLNAAFSESERGMIPCVTVSRDKNPSYSTSYGNSTTDQVFLLSITEANNYFSSNETRRYQGTAYCYARGAVKTASGYCDWWLRSPGYDSGRAAVINADGDINDYGGSVNGTIAVCPVLWIDLESLF